MIYEDGSWANIENVEDLNKIWNTLQKRYQAFDLAFQDDTLFQMIYHIQSDFKNIVKYGEEIQRRKVKCSEIENSVASWLQSFFFGLGLNYDIKKYNLQIVTANKVYKQELELEKMIIVFLIHEKWLKLSKQTKALVTKLIPEKYSKKTQKKFLAEDFYAIMISFGWKKNRKKDFCNY